MEVIDLEYSLPHGKTSYNKRQLNQVKQIVIHHTTNDGSIQAQAKYHVNVKGWPGIGYHFMIDKAGTIFKCNSIDVVCYNVENQNTKTIGICLIGNFEKQKPTPEQIASLKWLIDALRGVVGELPIFGHQDKKATTCPGKYLYRLIVDNEIA